jgi:predicted membrane-bound spermidine synthase
MGLSFPFLQRAVQTDVRRVGRRVGWLQSANIVGSTAGSALTGLVLLDVLGTAWTLRVLVALGGLFLLLLVRSRDGRLRTGPALACVVLTAAASAVSPSQAWLWARFHGTTPERILFDEDGSGLAVLGEETEDGRRRTVVFSNGIGMGHLPYGSYHTVLGALPALVHPGPESVAVIGLGSGDTLFGIGGRPQTLSMECVEIVSSQVPSLRMLYRKRPDPGLHRVLTDARVHLTFGDGRAFLMRSSARFDVIEADALRRDSAFSGNLYSLEYFELLRRRLPAVGDDLVPDGTRTEHVPACLPARPARGRHADGERRPDRVRSRGDSRAPARAVHRGLLPPRRRRHRRLDRRRARASGGRVGAGVRPLLAAGRQHGPLPARRVPRVGAPADPFALSYSRLISTFERRPL